MKVLVTGASGFVAGHVVHTLLTQGHTVIGTVRELNTPENTDYLKLMAQQYAGKFTLIEADLLQEGVFDAAASECDAVCHTASPFYRTPDTPEELIEPALKGTQNVLQACAKSSIVKRVVVTGSFASLIFAFDHTKDDARPYNEDDWNIVSNTQSPDKMHWYRYSKIVAEKYCWDYVKNNKPNFEVIVLNPPMIIGPWLPSYARPNESSIMIKETMTGERKVVPPGGVGYIDVRDVAQAHVAACERSSAKGRYLICGSTHSFLAVAVKIKDLYPTLPVVVDPPTTKIAIPKYDTSKAARDLGMTRYIDFEESLKLQCESLVKVGLVKV